MQVVYISNRPEVFTETLQRVSWLMPFIQKVVVCVPDELKPTFDKIRSQFPIQVVVESEILTLEEIAKVRASDHQSRNYLLRSRLARSTHTEPQFIMSDDDARPLKTISLDTFIVDERYKRYFFYDLAYWESNQTEFDAGQLATYSVLEYENVQHLSYASHMPQIIDKELFIESIRFFEKYEEDYPLCEWSTYFNYAGQKHSDRFHKPQPFATLCWPEHPLAWDLFVKPSNYLFENYTPTLYQRDHVFKLDWNYIKTSSEARSIDKLIRWKQYEIECKYPEQSKSALKYLNPKTWINKLRK